MIASVHRIVTVRAEDLPHLFSILVGTHSYSFEFESMDSLHVYMLSHDTNEIVNIPRDEYITVLVDEDWNDPIVQAELSLSLHNEGLL